MMLAVACARALLLPWLVLLSVVASGTAISPEQCTVNRYGAGELPAAEFRSRYHLQRPVLFTLPAGPFEPASSWAPGALLSRYAATSVSLGSNASLAADGGSGAQQPAGRAAVKLGTYLGTVGIFARARPLSSISHTSRAMHEIM